MAKVNYRIDGNKILFNAERVSPKELKVIKKLADGLGYELVPEIPEKEKKEPNPIWKESAIRNYLSEYGTKKQQETFEKKYSAPVLDKEGKPVFYKKDSQDGKHKKGDARIKGYVAVIQWFKKEFPDYPEAPKGE